MYNPISDGVTGYRCRRELVVDHLTQNEPGLFLGERHGGGCRRRAGSFPDRLAAHPFREEAAHAAASKRLHLPPRRRTWGYAPAGIYLTVKSVPLELSGDTTTAGLGMLMVNRDVIGPLLIGF
jgi:hypothetical protein